MGTMWSYKSSWQRVRRTGKTAATPALSIPATDWIQLRRYLIQQVQALRLGITDKPRELRLGPFPIVEQGWPRCTSIDGWPDIICSVTIGSAKLTKASFPLPTKGRPIRKVAAVMRRQPSVINTGWISSYGFLVIQNLILIKASSH